MNDKFTSLDNGEEMNSIIETCRYLLEQKQSVSCVHALLHPKYIYSQMMGNHIESGGASQENSSGSTQSNQHFVCVLFCTGIRGSGGSTGSNFRPNIANCIQNSSTSIGQLFQGR
jgi:hypothetical protein